MRSCLSEETAQRFVLGQLGGGAAAAVEQHLDECSDCHGFLAAVGRMLSAADLAPPAAPGEDEAAPAAAPSALGRGQSVGRYIVLDRIGQGGMSVVYAAYDAELDRKVALKVLRPGGTRRGAKQRARLLREAQALARLAHPNVIAVYDVGTVGEEVFVAMELVDGMTLGQWLAARPRPASELLAMFRQAGAGPAAAHAAGLVHRDFKPDNVLVGQDGRVRVVDFGLARPVPSRAGAPAPDATGFGSRAAALTQTGALLGTPAYMAPEQHLGHAADARTDQFSFGVALYEALHGERG